LPAAERAAELAEPERLQVLARRGWAPQHPPPPELPQGVVDPPQLAGVEPPRREEAPPPGLAHAAAAKTPGPLAATAPTPHLQSHHLL
jgi:hypothetical protein